MRLASFVIVFLFKKIWACAGRGFRVSLWGCLERGEGVGFEGLEWERMKEEKNMADYQGAQELTDCVDWRVG